MDCIRKLQLTNLFHSDVDQVYDMVYCLFMNVTNMVELSSDYESTGLCLIDPKLIVDERQLQVAVETALFHQNSGKLRTRSLNSEILFNLSPNNNISWSLKAFGIKPDENSLIAVKVVGSDKINSVGGDSIDYPFTRINGKPLPFTDLIYFNDQERIREIYNVPKFVETLDHLLDLIVTSIATKELM